MKTVEFGSLYLDGIVELPGVPLPTVNGKPTTRKIKLGDSVATAKITWNVIDDLYVANWNVLYGASWDILNKQSLIFGSVTEIDGKLFLCRSMTGGEGHGLSNEWDAIMKRTGAREDLWHCAGMYFFAQDTPYKYASFKKEPDMRVYRGGREVDGRGACLHDRVFDHVGFRPVLESLERKDVLTSEYIGRNLNLYLPGGRITGKLLDMSDYDLFLAGENKKSVKGCIAQNNQLVVNKNAVRFFNAKSTLLDKE